MNTDPFSAPPMTADAIATQANEAQVAIKNLEATAQDSAGAIEAAFAKAGESLSKSLIRAASDGKISLSELVKAILGAINTGVGTSTGGGLGQALSQALSVAANSYGGARTGGGGVASNQAYLVGENGPELFVPKSSGDIQTPSASSITVNLNLAGSPETLVRSEAQLAATLNRLVRMGVRS